MALYVGNADLKDMVQVGKDESWLEAIKKRCDSNSIDLPR